tara:strand:+ start:152 stop:637 length:486 start_codon:yes stop_codon:yes gene_type:complete
MAKNVYNHIVEIKDTQHAKIQALIPGMILKFRYESIQKKKKVNDSEPMILLLYFDRANGLFDGLNLNYLSHYRFHRLFKIFQEQTFVSTQEEEVSPLLAESFTFISIPPASQLQRPRSRSEARKEMKRLYKKTIGPKFRDVYRSYSLSSIKTLRVVNLKDY